MPSQMKNNKTVIRYTYIIFAVLKRVVCACPQSMRIRMRPAKALLAHTNVKADMRRNGIGITSP